MLQGAIIGAVVGLIMTIVMAQQRKKGAGSVLSALESSGKAAAREAIDKMQPAVTKIPTSKFVKLQERFAALAIIDDTDALEAEVNGVTGAKNVVVQLQGIGLLGLAVRADDPTPYAERLKAVSDEFERDGGKLMKLVKRNLRVYADIAAHLNGGNLADESKVSFGSLAQKNSMLGVVLYQAMGMHHRANGNDSDANSCFEVVKAQTQAFE